MNIGTLDASGCNQLSPISTLEDFPPHVPSLSNPTRRLDSDLTDIVSSREEREWYGTRVKESPDALESCRAHKSKQLCAMSRQGLVAEPALGHLRLQTVPVGNDGYTTNSNTRTDTVTVVWPVPN